MSTATIQPRPTIDDLFADNDGRLMELVRGELQEKKVGFLALWIATRIARLIGNYVDVKEIGWITTELPVDCFPWLGRHARRPDVVYFSNDRIPTDQPTEDRLTAVPNLVVEVISRHDNALELDEKIDEYRRAGVDVIWVVNPQNQTVRVYDHKGGVQILSAGQTIIGSDVIPGFVEQVRNFFPTPRPKK